MAGRRRRRFRRRGRDQRRDRRGRPDLRVRRVVRHRCWTGAVARSWCGRCTDSPSCAPTSAAGTPEGRGGSVVLDAGDGPADGARRRRRVRSRRRQRRHGARRCGRGRRPDRRARGVGRGELAARDGWQRGMVAERPARPGCGRRTPSARSRPVTRSTAGGSWRPTAAPASPTAPTGPQELNGSARRARARRLDAALRGRRPGHHRLSRPCTRSRARRPGRSPPARAPRSR